MFPIKNYTHTYTLEILPAKAKAYLILSRSYKPYNVICTYLHEKYEDSLIGNKRHNLLLNGYNFSFIFSKCFYLNFFFVIDVLYTFLFIYFSLKNVNKCVGVGM